MRAGLALALLLLAGSAAAGELERLTDALAAPALAALGPRAPRRDLALAVAAPAGAEALAAALADGLAARLGPSGRRAVAIPPTTPRAAAARGFEVLVEVELSLAGGHARALLRLHATAPDFWAGVAGVAPPDLALLAVGRADVALDAELAALLAGLPATAPATPPGREPRRLGFALAAGAVDLAAPTVALAIADLDGDGVGELVALTTEEVVALRLADGRAAVVARAPLAGPPVDPSPRLAFGALTVGSDGEILARTSRHRDGARLILAGGEGFLRRGDAARYPLAAELVPARHLFATRPLATPALADPAVAVVAAAGLLGAVAPGGVLAIAAPGASAPLWTIPGVGAAFVLADLDGDGAVELAAAAARPPGDGDELVVRELGPGGAAPELARSAALAGGVAALAAGDLDGDGRVDLVAAVRLVGSTRVDLWVLR